VGAATTSAADASAQLYARHGRMVFGLCRALLRNTADAEDASQQVFLSAHRSLLNGAEPREPAAWLAAIARNECRAQSRRRRREPISTDAADAVGGVDPVQEAIRRADLAALWRAIRALPSQQRDALLLREFGGLRYDELAAALAVTEPAVESLLFRARARLRAQLKAAYASLTGASWLDPLVRWLVGGGAPALATKAVALGLATSTAVVAAPEVVERHHAPPTPVQHGAAPAVHGVKRTPRSPAATAVRPAAPPPLAAAPVVPVARHVEAHRERHRTPRPVTTRPEPTGGDDRVAAVEPVTTTISTSGEGSHDGGGDGRDGGSSGSDGGGGGSGSDG
jgi:RNA polymerase sigma factor (sigma-70 family)